MSTYRMHSITAAMLVITAFATTGGTADASAAIMVTVAIDTGETIEYFDVRTSDVARLAAGVDGDIVAIAVPQVATIDSEPVWPTGDPDSKDQWALPMAGLATLPARANGTGIIVAVIDTGVHDSHEDLVSSVIDGGDFVTGQGQPSLTLDDPNGGHGTHIAGIIAAHKNNRIGIASGAPGATILAVRVLGANARGETNAIARGITAAVDAGAQVINLSIGIGGDDPLVGAAVADAVTRGVLVVASAGNGGLKGNNPTWPGADPNTLAVGSVHETGELSPFSTTGPQLDIAAPGADILSTYGPTNEYVLMSGTSMAAPHVAAAAAAIWSAHPQATAAQVRAALEGSVTDLGEPGWDTSYGAGLVNGASALAALDTLFGYVPPVVVPPRFTAIAPLRVFDTRAGAGGYREVADSKVGGVAALEVELLGIDGSIPAEGVGAVSLNVTVTGGDAAGFVTVYPCGERRLVSSVNFAAGATVANAVITKVSDRGTACFYSSTPVDVIVDANGWFPDQSGYTPVDPARIVDTRPASTVGVPAPVRAVGEHTIEVQVTGLVGLIPADDVAAVSLNVTATNTTNPGFVTVYPCGERRQVSSVNFPADGTVANAVLSAISAAGTVCVFTSTAADIVIDANGWFATGSSYMPLDPQRLFDTRPGGSSLADVASVPVGDGYVLTVAVTGIAGVPAEGVAAISLNVTATDPAGNGYVTIFPCTAGGPPTVSSLNYRTAATIANAVVTPISAQGTICLYSPVAVQLIADINGWFATAKKP